MRGSLQIVVFPDSATFRDPAGAHTPLTRSLAAMDLAPYDGILLVSFGGPEAPEEVRPFLERVVAGRGVPPERLDAVAEHYLVRGGVSPINAENRALIAALEAELARR